ncbi:MAG: sigma-70 family RNA polymerase sigma factor [Solirubrobacteraceae bacterium]
MTPGYREQLDPSSEAWLDGLRSMGVRQRGLLALSELLHAGARRELNRRRQWVPHLTDVDRDDLAQEIAGDVLLAVVARLDDFRGRSHFTTWAYAFTINRIAARLAQAARRPPAVPRDHVSWERLPDRESIDPCVSIHQREILVALRSTVERDLTELQRRVFAAVALNDAPIDELAVALGSNRNAVHKILFDARRKLRSARPPTTIASRSEEYTVETSDARSSAASPDYQCESVRIVRAMKGAGTGPSAETLRSCRRIARSERSS